MRYSRSAICILMGATLAAPNAFAQSQTTIGILTCTSANSPDTAEISNQMTCGFRPTGAGAEQRYSGVFKMRTTAGPPVGKLVWMWSVVGPETKLAGGGLAQKYVADARTASGSVTVLNGQSNTAISLEAEATGDRAGMPVEVQLRLLATLARTPTTLIICALQAAGRPSIGDATVDARPALAPSGNTTRHHQPCSCQIKRSSLWERNSQEPPVLSNV